MPIRQAVILVVDDDPKVKDSLEIAFPQYQFLHALNPEHALKSLKKPNEIDLIILDFKMGEKTGTEALKQIKQQAPDLGVIMLTGFGSKNVVIEALQNRADDFVDKPYNPTELGSKIERLLGARDSRERHMNGRSGSIERIVQLMKRNYKKDLTLADAGEIVSLSPKYVSWIFKNETHQSFTEFRIGLRMEQAKKMLIDSPLNVGQIADSVGYQNAESFMKIFKRIVGCTPTKYRTQGSELPQIRSKQRRAKSELK